MVSPGRGPGGKGKHARTKSSLVQADSLNNLSGANAGDVGSKKGATGAANKKKADSKGESKVGRGSMKVNTKSSKMAQG